MAPSSLKKMSGDEGRREGNHASLNSLPSLACFTSNDLGLTLLPGSQIQTEDEGESEVAATCSRENGQKGKTQGAEQFESVGSREQHKTPARALSLEQIPSRRYDSRVDTSFVRGHSPAAYQIRNRAIASQGHRPPFWAQNDTYDDDCTMAGDACIKIPQNKAQHGGHNMVQEIRIESNIARHERGLEIPCARAKQILQQIIKNPRKQLDKTVFRGAFTEACCNDLIQCKGLDDKSCGEMHIYILNRSQKSRFLRPSVQAILGVISTHVILSEPSSPEHACERFSPCAPQRLQYQSRYFRSGPYRSQPSTSLSTTNHSSSKSTTAIRFLIGSECTRKPTSEFQHHKISEAWPVSSLSPPDLRVKALSVVRAVKRSWTSHFPRRYQGPPASGRAGRQNLYSLVTSSSEAKVDETKLLGTCSTATDVHKIAATVSPSLSPTSLDTATQPAFRAYPTHEVHVSDDGFDTGLAILLGKVSHKRSTSLPNLQSSYDLSEMYLHGACQSAGSPIRPNSGQSSQLQSPYSLTPSPAFYRVQDANRGPHNALGPFSQFQQASPQIGQAFGGQYGLDMPVVNTGANNHQYPTNGDLYPGAVDQSSGSQRLDFRYGDRNGLLPHGKSDLGDNSVHPVARLAISAGEVESQAHAFAYGKENPWAQQNHALMAKVEQLEREKREMHGRLLQYDMYSKRCQHSLHDMRGQLAAAQEETIRLRGQNDSLLAAAKKKPRKVEDIISNVSKAHSPALRHDSGVGGSESQQWVPNTNPQTSSPANNAFTQGPFYSTPQATAYRSPYQHAAAQDQRIPNHHLPAPYQASPYQIAQYPIAQQIPAQEQYLSFEYGLHQSLPPQSFVPQQASPAKLLAQHEPAQNLPGYNDQHHPQATLSQNQTSSARFPLAPNHRDTAHVSPAQDSRTQSQSLLSPQGQVAPGKEVQVIDRSPRFSPEGERTPAEKVQNQDVPFGRPSIDLQRDHNVPQFGGGPNNPIQVDDVPNTIVDIEQPLRSGLQETPSMVGEVRTVIEARRTIEKSKNMDWYDGINPRTMTTDAERHLQFGLPSARKRTATSAFPRIVADGSMAPRATKIPKTSGNSSARQPKAALDAKEKAAVARQRKELQKKYRKKHTEKKKAEKHAQQQERASSISNTSQPHRSVERNNVPGPEEASQLSANQKGKQRASSPTETQEDMDSFAVSDGEDMDAENDEESDSSEDDGGLEDEFERAILESNQEAEMHAVERAPAAHEAEESEESEEE